MPAKLLGVVLLLAASLCILSQTPNLADDARLSKPLDVAERYLPLRKLAELAQAQSQVPFEVPPQHAERKLTLFCKDQSAATVLTMTANVLHGSWKLQKGKYVFEENADARAADRRALDGWIEGRSLAARSYLRDLAGIADVPASELQEALPALQRQISAAENDRTREKLQKQADLIVSIISQQPMMGRAFGQMVKNASETDFDRLSSGQTLIAGRPAIGGAPLLPVNALVSPDRPIVRAVALLRFASGRVEGRFISGDDAETDAFNMASSWTPSIDSWAPPIPGLKSIEEREKKWASQSDPAVLGTKLTDEVSPLPRNLYCNQALTLADQLQELHHRTGLPIVALAYRVPETYLAWTQGKTVRDWIESLAALPTYLTQRGVRFRSEQGWLLARKTDSWQLDAIEPSEALIVKAETATKPTQMLSLADYAAFANGLTPLQSDSFVQSRQFCARFRMSPLSQGMVGLRLLGCLSAKQQQKLAGPGVTYGELSPKQQERFRIALSDGIWQGIPPVNVLAQFAPGAPAFPPQMSMFFVDSKNSNHMTSLWPEALTPPSNEPTTFTSDPTNSRSYSQIRLGISAKTTDSVSVNMLGD